MGNTIICYANDMESLSNYHSYGIVFHFDAEYAHAYLEVQDKTLRQTELTDPYQNKMKSALVMPKLPNALSSFTVRLANPKGIKVGIAHRDIVERDQFQSDFFLENKEHGMYVVNGDGKYYKHKQFGGRDNNGFSFTQPNVLVSVQWDPRKGVVSWKYQQDKSAKSTTSTPYTSPTSIYSPHLRENVFQMQIKQQTIGMNDLYGIVIFGEDPSEVEILGDFTLFKM